MNTLFEKNFAPKQIEYLTINFELIIIENSWGVARFSDFPDHVQSGKDVCIAFPELIGLEETFRKIISEQVNQFELKGISKNTLQGTAIYFDIYVVKNPGVNPENQQLLILFEDTTELFVREKKITQALKEYGLILSALEKTNSYLDKLINSMTDMLIITNSQGMMKLVNQSTIMLLEYSKKELIKQSILLIFEDNKFNNTREIQDFLTSDLVMSVEVQCKTKTGTYFPVCFSCSSLNFDSNDDQEFLWIGRDMSEQKRVEFQFRQQVESDRILKNITQRIHQSLSLQETLQTIVIEVRQFLKVDRVLIYRFYSSEEGQVIAESIINTSVPLLNRQMLTPDFNALLLSHFKAGKIDAVDDLYLRPIHLNYLHYLLQLNVTASLIVPIVIYDSSQEFKSNNELWGLLMAHQCEQPRHWEIWEVNLLEELAVQIAIALQQAELYEQLQFVNQELEQLVIQDGLTGLSNRRHFDRVLYQEWNRSRREGTPLSLVLLDIDYFKQYNDTYGHLAGDNCLQQVAQVLQNLVEGTTNLVARYGGEEFAIILPNTNSVESFHLAEKIRQQVEALSIPHIQSEVSHYVTISIGIATLIPIEHLTPQTLIHTADQGLYQAKKNGRNSIFIATA